MRVATLSSVGEPMPHKGETLVVSINSDSNVADGVAHPWDSSIHVHVRRDDGFVYEDEKYRIELVQKVNNYWIAEVIDPISLNQSKQNPASEPQSTKVYWVGTSKSYCYHTSQNCPQLKKREGRIKSAHITRKSGKLPKEVQQRRPCSNCE